jgi:hypothetical protein
VHPLAQVLLGGLLTVVPVTLLLVPAVYLAGEGRATRTEAGDARAEVVEAPSVTTPRSSS